MLNFGILLKISNFLTFIYRKTRFVRNASVFEEILEFLAKNLLEFFPFFLEYFFRGVKKKPALVAMVRKIQFES